MPTLVAQMTYAKSLFSSSGQLHEKHTYFAMLQSCSLLSYLKFSLVCNRQEWCIMKVITHLNLLLKNKEEGWELKTVRETDKEVILGFCFRSAEHKPGSSGLYPPALKGNIGSMGFLLMPNHAGTRRCSIGGVGVRQTVEIDVIFCVCTETMKTDKLFHTQI